MGMIDYRLRKVAHGSGKLTKEHTDYDFLINTGGKIIDIGYEYGKWMGICRGKWVMSDMVPLNEKERLEIDFTKRGQT